MRRSHLPGGCPAAPTGNQPDTPASGPQAPVTWHAQVSASYVNKRDVQQGPRPRSKSGSSLRLSQAPVLQAPVQIVGTRIANFRYSSNTIPVQQGSCTGMVFMPCTCHSCDSRAYTGGL
eukprot:GHUV01031810.1.p4 GENE.GHUV01031810.1~~GHUV01031810.1.p4  ORF type:complete len:119 (+),score=9.62 GHUV01031810.1:435-791(+)